MTYKFAGISGGGLKQSLDLFNFYIGSSTALWLYEKIGMREFREIMSFGIKNYKLYEITKGKEFCGFCSFKQYNKRPGYDRTAALSIFLKPEFTGKGIGSAAVQFLEKQSKNAGIRVLVACISGDNRSSIRLFEKTGYKKCANIRQAGEKFGKLLDDVIYQKIIAS